MIQVVLLPGAEDDLHDAREFYGGKSARLGNEFVAEIDRTIGLLLDAPEMGRPLRRGERKLIVRRFPYSVIYRYHGEQIIVLAFAHHRQKPGFWSDRR